VDETFLWVVASRRVAVVSESEHFQNVQRRFFPSRRFGTRHLFFFQDVSVVSFCEHPRRLGRVFLASTQDVSVVSF